LKIVCDLVLVIWNLVLVIELNQAPPLIMHVDLNSAFASIEQQANPLLRGKPVAITNRLSNNATIIAASYEAKGLGITTGTKVYKAKIIEPKTVVLESDVDKYLHAHRLFKNILQRYSPSVIMKSIDEGVINFEPVRLIEPRPLIEIAKEIKQSIKTELGEWITCNIGIGPNRFLAKLAAGLHKPDGTDIIDHHNLELIYSLWNLQDLPGINWRMERRLNLNNIYTPLQFLHTPLDVLWHEIFRGISGYYWYRRLRGWEIDNTISQTKTVGKQYVLPQPIYYPHQLMPIVMKLVQLMGRRLRRKGFCATGIVVGCLFKNGLFWQQRHKNFERLYSTQQIYTVVSRLLINLPYQSAIKIVFMRCYDLLPAAPYQTNLFEKFPAQIWHLTDITDIINNRFGEFTIIPAAMAGTSKEAVPKIAFGRTEL
jgi:DNA polymerase-4